MGAWIEIYIAQLPGTLAWSLLSWERGLKFDIVVTVFAHVVAPLVGAWIEIGASSISSASASGRSSRGSVD